MGVGEGQMDNNHHISVPNLQTGILSPHERKKLRDGNPDSHVESCPFLSEGKTKPHYGGQKTYMRAMCLQTPLQAKPSRILRFCGKCPGL